MDMVPNLWKREGLLHNQGYSVNPVMCDPVSRISCREKSILKEGPTLYFANSPKKLHEIDKNLPHRQELPSTIMHGKGSLQWMVM